MDAQGAKIFVLIFLSVLKLFFGLLPLALSKMIKKRSLDWLNKLMSGMVCFGGGVLIATIFLHMQPEVRDFMHPRDENGELICEIGSFSYGDLVFCSGFFLVYLSEKVIEKIIGVQHSHDSMAIMTSLSNKSQVSHYDKEAPSDSHPKETKDKPSVVSSIRSIITIGALSIHAIFEGLAIGLQLTAYDVWMLFLAVSIHECAILFCVGNDMVVKNEKKKHILIEIGSLGLVTPIGTIIGIVLTINYGQDATVGDALVGILQGLAGGTLLYITFFEVLDRHKLEKSGMDGILGVILMLIGFGFMTGLTIMDIKLTSGGNEPNKTVASYY